MRKVKNLKGYVIGGLIGATLMFSVQGFAAIGDQITATFASFNLIINGQVKTIDTTPLVYNGTSYLPIRDIANLVGYDVTYKADSRTIELNNVSSAVYGSVSGSVYTTPVPTPSTDPQMTSTPSPSPDNTPVIQNTPIPTQSQNNMEEISNYFADKNQHALKVNGVIFVTIRGGADKYKIYDATWNADTFTLSFTKENVNIKISNIIGDGDGFIYQGSTYVKESIFSNMVK